LLSTIDATADDKLTRFALRLALAGHVGIPCEGEFDFLAEARTVFAPQEPTKKVATKKAKQPTPVESPAKVTPKAKVQKPTGSKKKIAA
jgi:ParB family chromosome partitioning protein